VIHGDDGRIEGKQFNVPSEGVLIHGLFLEGAGWNKNDNRLEDSQPKELYYQFPILHVSAVSVAASDKPG
jgi:dynein heavy chain